MKKQTAVNYVRDEAIKLVAQAMQGILNEDTLESEISQIVTTALQMEKEQIIDAANKLLYHGTGPGDTAAEQYYNEKYGGDK